MRARKTGCAWEVFAPAKLNLYLEILGRRDDGFHELETLMTPVRIYDQLQWSPAPRDENPRFTLEYDGSTSLDIQRAAPADQHNLVWKAYDLIGRTSGVEPTGRARLAKRIPVQAGMGGASSDAAAALVLANAAWGIDYSRARLGELAAELGSDVPFFLAGSAAICRGRGERVDALGSFPRLHLVVVKPAAGVSTAAAFKFLNAGTVSAASVQDSRAAVNRLVDNLKGGAVARAGRGMVNRLEIASAAICPWIAQLREAFTRTECLVHMMTGSGSAYFGVTRTARQALRIARQLSAQGWGPRGRGRNGQCDSPQRSETSGTVFATATC